MRTKEVLVPLVEMTGALTGVDPAAWPDEVLSGQLAELSLLLCRLDREVARIADAVRARGHRIQEPTQVPAGRLRPLTLAAS